MPDRRTGVVVLEILAKLKIKLVMVVITDRATKNDGAEEGVEDHASIHVLRIARGQVFSRRQRIERFVRLPSFIHGKQGDTATEDWRKLLQSMLVSRANEEVLVGEQLIGAVSGEAGWASEREKGNRTRMLIVECGPAGREEERGSRPGDPLKELGLELSPGKVLGGVEVGIVVAQAVFCIPARAWNGRVVGRSSINCRRAKL